uniref:Nucleolar protein with MIF4G domain 1 n=1 Tax=Sphenodon punctatus TaxID=8508 RepID=A0A8D0GB67_SPHPU
MKRAAGAAGRGRGSPGRSGKRRPKLQKLGLAVREFVQATAAGAVSQPPPGGQQGPEPAGGRRNRRELRKEKRRLKRSRRRRRYLHPEPGEQRPRGKSPRLPPERPPTASAAATDRKRALLEANEEENREIRRLERCLGLGKRRKKGAEAASTVPQSFARDGLGYVLGALDSGATISGLYESSEEEGGLVPKEEESDDEGSLGPSEENDSEDEEAAEDGEEEEMMEMAAETSEESDAEGNGESEESISHASRIPENQGGDRPSEAKPPNEEKVCSRLWLCQRASLCATKYVPPQMRRSEETVDAKKREELERLKKTLKGLMNRLSEPNLASVSGQLEELYMANSRNDMNETLTSVLMNACVTAHLMPARLIMEHVLLVSILHHTVGIEVTLFKSGAHFTFQILNIHNGENTVNTHPCLHSIIPDSKMCARRALPHNYFPYILCCCLPKMLPFSLRSEDLKIILVRFMLETMLALKNNDMRKIPGYDPEPVEKLRKLQRTLVHNSGSGRETQLRVSLDSLLAADQIGRWWIVGSSWSGAPMLDSTTPQAQPKLPIGKVSSKILELARKQRMNTDIRRNIFCVLMGSEDFLDAFEKLLKLGLKDQQEREIVHVLIDCCLQEKTYNPFYSYLASKFCEYERRFQMTFQFSMWDKIRDLGNLSATAFSNLVSLLAHLLKTKSLSLSVFKVIEFSELDKPKVHFLRQVLNMLLTKTEPEELNHIFGKLADNPKLGMLREGLKLFLTHFLLKNIQAHQSAQEATLLKERVELANRTLQAKESKLKL